MSSNYLPSETSDFAGSTLDGTMTTDRASGPTYQDIFSGQANAAPQPVPPPPPSTPLEQNTEALGFLGQSMAQGQPKNFFKSINFNAETGAVKIETDQGALAEVMGQLTDLKTMKAAAMARVAQLRQQEQSGSPILDALSQFAGGMAANDPTMPGWVRALGATSLQMGNQGIERKRMMEEDRALQIGKAQSDLAGDMARTEQMGWAREDRLSAREDKAAEMVLSRYKPLVAKGAPLDPGALTQELVSSGVPAEKAVHLAFSAIAQSDAMRATLADDTKKKVSETVLKLNDDFRAQINSTNGVFDAPSYRAAAESLKIPEEQIAANVTLHQNYAKSLKQAKAIERREKADDTAAAEGRASAVWQSRFETRDAAAKEAALEKEEAITDRKVRTDTGRYVSQVLVGSKPPVDARQGMEGAVQYIQFADQAKAAVQKYGDDVGWKRITGPTGELFKLFRKSTGEELANLEVMDVMEKVKGSGLAPFSELDKEMLAAVSFSRWKSPEANLQSLLMGRQKALRRLTTLSGMNPQWDWDAMMPGMPAEIKAIRGELYDRRRDYWARYAMEGVDPDAPFQRPASIKDVTDKWKADAAATTTTQAEGGGPGYIVESRTINGKRVAVAATTAAALPPDFVSQLSSLPAGQGLRFSDGKIYKFHNGVAVEVR